MDRTRSKKLPPKSANDKKRVDALEAALADQQNQNHKLREEVEMMKNKFEVLGLELSQERQVLQEVKPKVTTRQAASKTARAAAEPTISILNKAVSKPTGIATKGSKVTRARETPSNSTADPDKTFKRCDLCHRNCGSRVALIAHLHSEHGSAITDI